jgi:hypothetical protein
MGRHKNMLAFKSIHYTIYVQYRIRPSLVASNLRTISSSDMGIILYTVLYTVKVLLRITETFGFYYQ